MHTYEAIINSLYYYLIDYLNELILMDILRAREELYRSLQSLVFLQDYFHIQTKY